MNKRRSRVLVVDEDAVVLLTIEGQLDTLGWEAVPVDTGEDAIRIVELGFIIDVLLTELTLPDGEGSALARAVTSVSPTTRVAFMSASGPVDPLEPRDAPFLIKPFTTAALAHALAGAAVVTRGDRPRLI